MKFNRISLAVITPPAESPVTVAEMKLILRIDGTSDDALLQLYIDAAVDWAQKYTRRAFITQTLELTLDGFSQFGDEGLAAVGPGVHDYPRSYFITDGSNEVNLPFLPIQSVTSIKTKDVDNSETTVDSSKYELDTTGGRIFLDIGEIWPVNLRERAAVKIRYVAGYGAASAVPAAIKQGIRQHVQKMYECAGVCEGGDACNSLFDGYRLFDDMGFL